MLKNTHYYNTHPVIYSAVLNVFLWSLFLHLHHSRQHSSIFCHCFSCSVGTQSSQLSCRTTCAKRPDCPDRTNIHTERTCVVHKDKSGAEESNLQLRHDIFIYCTTQLPPLKIFLFETHLIFVCPRIGQRGFYPFLFVSCRQLMATKVSALIVESSMCTLLLFMTYEQQTFFLPPMTFQQATEKTADQKYCVLRKFPTQFHPKCCIFLARWCEYCHPCNSVIY